MTKKDICAGDILLLRDGCTCMVMPSFYDKDRLMLYGRQFLHSEVSSIASLDNYTDDLINSDGFATRDIMAVRTCFTFCLSDPKVVFNLLYSKCDPNEIYWDWKREEVKEVTMAEVEEKFGCKVKIVKEEDDE